MLGRKHSSETRQKIKQKRSLQKGRTYTTAQRAEVCQRMRGVPKSAAHRAALSASLIGRPTGRHSSPSLSTRNKISRALIGHKRSLESIRKAAEANRGQKRSLETRQRMSLAQRNRGPRKPLSMQHRKNISTALKGRVGNSKAVLRGWTTRRIRYGRNGRRKNNV